MTSRTVTVVGMTCQHCVAAVTEEVSGLDGVTSVSIALDTGRVDIESDAPVDDAALAAAIDEAGYELAQP